MKKKFFPYIAASLIVILLLLPLSVLATEAEPALTEYPFEDTITVSDLPDNDELFAGYVEKTLYPDQVTTFGISAGKRLNQRDRALYDIIKSNLELIANGETPFAYFTLDAADLPGITTEFSYADFADISDNPINDAFESIFWAQYNFDAIFDALLNDCPYDLYWFDKTKGGGLATFSGFHYASKRMIEVTTLYFSFQVSKDYQTRDYDESYPTVNLAKTKATKGAVNRATAIVKQYQELPDYEKLLAYKTEICNLVDYNHDAAKPDYDNGYGDPWQIIYVFDGLASTNVVCEGYAKAFQYLCDLSTFDGDICCYTVSGLMDGGTGAGGHMWNIVTMGDGKNYLVDITNSDGGSIVQNGELFLAGTNGNLTNGYRFTIDSNNWISFTYYPTTISLWGDEDDSILNLASSSYDFSAFEVEYAEVTVGFHDTMVVEKSHNTNDDLVLKIEPKRGNVLPPEILHYVLVYDSDKMLKDIREIPCVVGDDGITLTVSNPHVKPDETYKVIVWADNQAPLIHAISDITK